MARAITALSMTIRRHKQVVSPVLIKTLLQSLVLLMLMVQEVVSMITPMSLGVPVWTLVCSYRSSIAR